MTGTVRPVVVGADGSAHSMVAVAWAATEAMRRGLPLTVACVVGTRPIGPPPLADSIVDEARDLAGAVAPGVVVRTVVRVGDPVGELADLARDADLLVVGRRGAHERGSGKHGSTSAALARTAPGTVAVVDIDERRFPVGGCTGPTLPPPTAVRRARPLTTGSGS